MDICEIQQRLQIEETGEIDLMTVAAIKNFQIINNMKVTGTITEEFIKKLQLRTTTIENNNDITDIDFTTDQEELKLIIEEKFLHKNQYYSDRQNKIEYIFLHHTAGWDNPYQTVKDWETDQRGRIGTAFVIGGKAIKGHTIHDGKIIQCIPDYYWASHLGSYKTHGINYNMHKNSIGIELCNFGPLEKRGIHYVTYTGAVVPPDQVTTVEFRGYSFWHSYSEKQLKSLENLIIYLSNKFNIDIKSGLPTLLKSNSIISAFEYSKKICEGQIKGLLSHTNVRKDKYDVYPHPKLVDLLKRFG